MKKVQPIEHPAIPTPTILQVEGLCFQYPQRELFANLSIRIPPGVTLVRGGDGSGKTTLLRLLAGELAADAGRIQVNGVAVDASAACRQQVFWTDPRARSFDQLTPVEYFRSLHRLYPGIKDPVLGNLIEGLSLRPHLDKPLYMLSAGSKRKVWLAAAFASGAAVTLLDEPFAALDKASIAFVLDLLRDAADLHASAWVIAHYEAPPDVPLAALVDLGDQ